MADEEHGSELPQRARGATRAAPPVSRPPSSQLSEELRRRMQAAVEAERAEGSIKEQEETIVSPGGPAAPGAAAGAVTASPAKEISGKRKQPAPESERVTEPKPVARAAPAARAAPDFIREAEDVTQWVPVQSVAAVKPAKARTANSKRDATSAQASRPAALPPAPPKKLARRRRRRRVAVPAVIAVLAALLSVAAVRYFTRSPVRVLTASQLRQEAAARSETVAWVVRHVGRDVQVACDPVMRAALAAHGFPSRDLLLLGPTTPDPAATAATVVVETPTVHGMFGSSLDSAWAPDVLASFGSGAANVTIRVVARHGVTAYQKALSQDLQARRIAGSALLNDSLISVPALAGNQLAVGRVDSRLVLALADLASHRPIIIVQFGNDGPGASADIPLRYVDLAQDVGAAHLDRAAYVDAVRDFLSQVKADYRPASMTTMVADGQAVLRIEVTAPSPFGVFGQ